MCEKNKADFTAYMECGDFEILSASPERFIKISENVIETFPVKGTRPRGKNKEEDEMLKKELLESEKEKAELSMITDLLRNDMGKVCAIGSVKVIDPRIARAYTFVWHTYSHIKGILADGVSKMDALTSMFPGGSITGCPKKRAMEIIAELEWKQRGIYTGAIGYKEGEELNFNIAIRTIIKKGNKAYLSVGGGIVYDSTEDGEYEETLHKAKSFFGLL